LLIALISAAYWAINDPTRAVKAFASVLIVACPCALALAAPFTLGSAQRVLARQQISSSRQICPSVARTRCADPKVKGAASASAHGHATINTEANALTARVGSLIASMRLKSGR